MKILIFLAFLMISTLSAVAQDIFVATEFTDDGKNINKLITPKYFILNKLSVDRTQFKVIQNSVLLLDGFLTKSTLVKNEEGVLEKIESRKMTIVSIDGITYHEFFFTLHTNKVNKHITFIVTTTENNITKRSYLGRIN